MGALATFGHNVVNLFRATPRTDRASLFSEKAVDQFLNILTSPADPDEVLRRSNIARWNLRALTGDDEITTAMDTRREALLAVPWRLEPVGAGEDGANFPEPVQWLWDQFEPFAESVLRACMEALPYGYSVQEAVYRQADDQPARITWKQITEKPFEWFIPRLDGTVLYRGLTQINGEEVDPRKFFLTVRNQTYRQPYGDALYSRLYWPWFFRQQGWRFWARWLERFGTPLLLGTTQGDPKAMVAALSEAVNGAVAAVGHGDTVQAVESKGTGTQFSTFDDQICKRIQKIILGQTLTTDIQHRGSFAAAQVHNEVRIDRRNADIRMVTTSVQRIITTLWQLNNFPGAAPRFVIEDGQGLEVERAARDVAMVTAGMMDVTEEYLKRVYDFEDGDFKIPVKPDPTKLLPAPGANPFQPKGTRATLFATAVQRYTPKQQVIEDALSLVLGELPASPIDDAAIRAAILASRDSRELVANLSTLLADLDPRTFQTVLERALYAADLTGYEHANRPDLPPAGDSAP